MANKPGDLRIWHNSNFGNPPFLRPVKTVTEAKKFLELIADYDMYVDVCANAQGLEVWDSNEWTEWEDPKTGDDIVQVMRGVA